MIYQFTTPPIIISISADELDVSTITELVITIMQGSITVEKTLDDVTIDTTNNAISFDLTQAETGTFSNGLATVQLHYAVEDTVGCSNEMMLKIGRNIHGEAL